MSSEYQFVRISEEKLDDFAYLAKNAFGVESTPEERRALFDTKAAGKDYIGYLAYSADGEPAAFYGVFPSLVEYGGKQYLAAQSGSTMTHTNHRKKGLFYKLAQETFELAQREGIAFIYGFPNSSSYPGFMKLKWTHDGNFHSYHIFVPTLPLGYLAQKLKFLQPLFAMWFRFVCGFWRVKVEPFPNSTLEPDTGAVSHDAAFFSYKKESDNRFMLKIGGWRVWINEQQSNVGIGDIELIDDGRDFKKVLRGLKFICFLSGVIHIRTYVSAGSKLDCLLRASGYKPRQGLANCYFDLASDLPLENFKYVYADYDTF